MMKLAVISPVLPPSQSGQAIVLYRLFDEVDPDQYILISPINYNRIIEEKDECSKKLSGKYYHLPHNHAKLLYWLLIFNYNNIMIFNKIYLYIRIKRFIKIFQSERCSHVVACTADLFDPYCAYIAARELNLPFYLYMFDDYIQQWTNKYYHDFAQKVGPSIIKNAMGIIVPNEHLKKFCDMNYQVNAKIIHNPVNLSDYTGSSSSKLDYSVESEIDIVYTGAIYNAQSDALNRLVDAISNIKERNIKLHIYSPNHWKPLENKNEFVVYHDSLPQSKMPDIQKGAHILFLPLAFKSEYPESLIQTSSPGKMGEYLASGRPVIVHSPPDSFVTGYFKAYECGSVVDLMDENSLIKEITKIIDDEKYRHHIMKNAQKRASSDFDLKQIKERFFICFT